MKLCSGQSTICGTINTLFPFGITQKRYFVQLETAARHHQNAPITPKSLHICIAIDHQNHRRQSYHSCVNRRRLLLLNICLGN